MLSPAMQKAIRFMAKRGGEGIIDNRGWVMCAGDRAPYEAATWLRLVSEGLVGPAGSQRLALTGAGMREAAKVPDSPSAASGSEMRGPRHVNAWDWSDWSEIDGGRT